jgi:hypothetical protein
VRTRPALPGLLIPVDEVVGAVQLSVATSDGTESEVHGRLHLRVRALGAPNPLIGTALERWLGRERDLAVTVEIGGIRARPDGRHDVALVAELRHRRVPLTGTGRFDRRPDGTIEGAGTTLCDPRSFGVALPPLVTLIVPVRWRLVLAPREVGRPGAT